MRSRFHEHLSQAGLAGCIVTVIETGRDEERQAYYVEIGVSHTEKSLHLPQPPKGKALAYDIAPKDYLAMKGWNPGGDLWILLGTIGEGLGMEWGGRWPTLQDRPHYQLKKCAC